MVGLSIALELRRVGLTVHVLERERAGAGASTAAAGMLAAHDPNHPPALVPLALRAAALYPEYLQRIASLGGETVPFETEWTLERSDQGVAGHELLPSFRADAGPFELKAERSIDPRKLMRALLLAVKAGGAVLFEGARDEDVARGSREGVFIDCRGAWHGSYVRPVKGQMLRVADVADRLALSGKGNVVVRTNEVYVIPRLDGTCLIGATVEDAGFDTSVQADQLANLRRTAAVLLPFLADAPEVESWAGLRPSTLSGLPVLGRTGSESFVANGMYRNGMLLAPAVAEVICALITNQPTKLDLGAFSPAKLFLNPRT